MIYFLYYLGAGVMFALGYGIGHNRGMVRGEAVGRAKGIAVGWNEYYFEEQARKKASARDALGQFAARKGRN